jgi:hypothetical protein
MWDIPLYYGIMDFLCEAIYYIYIHYDLNKLVI